MAKWIKTNFPGVRYREHLTRKHGVKKDQYFTIRYKLNGKDKEEGLGWATQDWTAAKAYDRLKELKENRKAGEGPQTLKEKRNIEDQRKEAEQEENKKREKANLTVEEYFENTYYPTAKTHKKKQTYTKEELHFRLWIAPVIGIKPLKDITHFDIERIKKKLLDAGKAPRTAQYVLATTRQIWNMARRDGFVTSDSPTRSVKVAKFDNRRQRFLSHAEADALLKKLKETNEQVYQIAFLALYTGLRASEAFNLTWGCIDTEHGILSILDAKSGKGRKAFMTESLKSMFLAMPKGKHDELVFPNSNGKPYTEIPHPFREVVSDLKFNEGVQDRRQRVMFHSLRHTFGSWHAEAGTNLYVIKELMGHGSITLTERYSHLTKGTLQAATRNLERAIHSTDGAEVDQVVNFPK
jgi:site-specific recombinase XerD